MQFYKRIGGLNRAAAVLAELVEAVEIGKINREFVRGIQTSVLQRLGYLLETVIEKQDFADQLYACTRAAELNFFPVSLDAGRNKRGFSAANRWKIMVNTTIELDS